MKVKEYFFFFKNEKSQHPNCNPPDIPVKYPPKKNNFDHEYQPKSVYPKRPANRSSVAVFFNEKLFSCLLYTNCAVTTRSAYFRRDFTLGF